MNNALMTQKDGKMCAAGALLVLVPVAAALWIGVQIWSEWNHQRQADISAAFEAGKQWSCQEEQKWYEHGRLHRTDEKPKVQKDRDEEEKATLEPEAERSKAKSVVLASGGQEWLVQEERKL